MAFARPAPPLLERGGAFHASVAPGALALFFLLCLCALTTLARSVKPAPISLRQRLEEVRARVGSAAVRSGRAPGAVSLVGVSKNVPAAVVAEAVVLGLGDLGENRVQEAQEKIAVVGRQAARWHMIGHLQRNKAGRAVELFDRVHAVDGLELAVALSRRAAALGLRLPVMVEVNVSGEASKFGVAEALLGSLVESVARLEGLALDGLMTVGRAVERAEQSRPQFARLRELRDQAERSTGLELPQLSMGMSGDFEVAIEEGSTIVRVGTALFGVRG